MNDLISVIMSAYNETESELNESINSILMQSYSNIELIIVNDNPDDTNLKHLLNQYLSKDKRIIIIENEKNLGLAQSLNKALDRCTGSYVARMDADDVSLPQRLKIQYEYLNDHPECDMVSSNCLYIDANSKPIGKCTHFNIPDKNIKRIIKYGSVIIHPTVMLRRSLYLDMDGYNNFRAAQDYDLWLRIIGTGRSIHIQQDVLLKYRIRENSITKTNYLRQYLYSIYAVNAYKTRKIDKHYPLKYSECDVENFLKQNKLDDLAYVKKINSVYEKVQNAFSKKNIPQIVAAFPSIICNKTILTIVYRNIMYKIMLKLWSKGDCV